MRKMLLAAVLTVGAGCLAVPSASAAPAAGTPIAVLAGQGNAVIDVAEGCGPGRHRGARGHCHRNVPEPRSQSR